MRNKFAYAWGIKILAVGFNDLLESIFCLLVVEVFSLQKVVEMLEEVIVNWSKVRWVWWMKQNIVDPIWPKQKWHSARDVCGSESLML